MLPAINFAGLSDMLGGTDYLGYKASRAYKQNLPMLTQSAASSTKTRVGAKRKRVATQAYVQNAINRTMEQKYHIVAGSGDRSYDSPTITHLTDISQGDTDVTREGDSVNLRRIRINIVAQNVDTTTNYGYRAILFKWKEDSVPTAVDIIGPTGGALDTNSWYDNHNHDQRHAYSIIFDTGPIVIGHTNSGSIPQRLSMVVDKRLRGKVYYTSGSTASGRGALWLLQLSEVTNASQDINTEFNAVVDFSD